MRVAGYIRVSDPTQVERLSLATQERLIREYCARQDWPAPTIYREAGRSAYTDEIEKRPALHRLVGAVEGGEYTTLVVYDLDRFARDTILQLTVARQLQRLGCAIVSLSQTVDLATPEGRFGFTINAALNEMYSAQISRKTRAGLAEVRARGGYVGGIPYGAERDADYRLRLRPDRAAALRLLLELAAQGSYRATAAALNAAGITTGHSAAAWQPSTVHLVVKNGRWLLDQPAPWPALWVAAATRPRAAPLNRDKAPHELTGLLRCACGGAVLYNGAHTRKDGTTTTWLTCRVWDRERAGGRGCPRGRKRGAAHYEAEARRQLLALPDLTRTDLATPDVRAARTHLAERRLNVARAVARGLPDDEAAALEAAIARDEALLPLDSGTERAVARQLQLAQWAWDTEGAAWRNAIWRRLVVRMVIDGPDLTIEWVPPLARLLAQWARDRGKSL